MTDMQCQWKMYLTPLFLHMLCQRTCRMPPLPHKVICSYHAKLNSKSLKPLFLYSEKLWYFHPSTQDCFRFNNNTASNDSAKDMEENFKSRTFQCMILSNRSYYLQINLISCFDQLNLFMFSLDHPIWSLSWFVHWKAYKTMPVVLQEMSNEIYRHKEAK